jgi:guanine deaminase
MAMSTPEDFMRRAIELSRRKLADGERPFGAVIVRNAEILAEGSAQQLSTNDPTAHAEIVAIRAAANALGTNDLSECDLYTSCEPCPMCTGAIWYGRLRKTYYANVTADFEALGRTTQRTAADDAVLPIEQRPRYERLLAGEARQVLEDWKKSPEFTAAMQRST